MVFSGFPTRSSLMELRTPTERTAAAPHGSQALTAARTNGLTQPSGRNIDLYRTLEYGQGPFALLPTTPYAYYQQWNVDVQRELPEGTLVDLAYGGTKGTHLPDFAEQLNALPDRYLSLGSHLYDTVPNPFFGLIATQTGTGLSLNTSALAQGATTTLGQLLLPYPQYTGYSIGAAGWGSSIY